MTSHTGSEYGAMMDRLTSEGLDISRRNIRNSHVSSTILYIKSITNPNSLSEYIIRPMLQYVPTDGAPLGAEMAADQVILAADCQIMQDMDKIHEVLLSGKTIVLFDGSEEYLTVDIKKVEQKSVDSPELTFTIRGPKDAFTENLDVNMSLIRYRLKDPKLRFKMMEVGRRTKTRVAVAYIQDIASDKYVGDIVDKISKVDTDGILESGELQAFLQNKKHDLFPQMGIVERSDAASSALLEGKVLIITEGSGLALVAPRVFGEYLLSCDDIYDNKYFGVLNKILRIDAIIMTLTMSSLYVAIISFHSDILPGEYILTVSNMRSMVPFNAFTEALLVEVITELLREALLRVPKQIGPAIGIVGAIIIGQAAVFAGIFSPLILIIGSLTLLTSFVAPDYTIVNPIRVLKFGLLILTGAFGLLGFTMGMYLILTEIISMESFGVPFFAPLAPFLGRDAKRSILLHKDIAPERPEFIKTKDGDRGPTGS